MKKKNKEENRRKGVGEKRKKRKDKEENMKKGKKNKVQK